MSNLFFTTQSCQLCKPIKNKIEEGVYKNITVISEDIPMMMKYGVRSVPALYVYETKELIVGQSAVIKYLEGSSV